MLLAMLIIEEGVVAPNTSRVVICKCGSGAPGQDLTMCCPDPACKKITPLKQRGRPPGRYGTYRKVRIGADPEFELHKNGIFFPANKVLFGLNTPLGTDGISTTGELRPCLKSGGTGEYLFYQVKGSHNAPSSQGISALLTQLARMLDESSEVYAGSGCCRPLGGHIHFSGIDKDEVFLATLDRLITLPLKLVSETQLRTSKGYGKPGATEERKFHGGWEYRSPLSWISTPDVAKGVLSMAWLLAQAQRHGCLAQFQTWDDFLDYPRKGHARNIRKFKDTLHDLNQRNLKLENIEVLKAWDLRHLLKPVKKPRQNRKRLLPVDWALADAYFPAIEELVGNLSSPLALRIVGASQSRSARKVVFLPEGWGADLTRFPTVALQHWHLPWIGLSWSLRHDVPFAAQVVRQIVASVRIPVR
jgi:hypothetical protein